MVRVLLTLVVYTHTTTNTPTPPLHVRHPTTNTTLKRRPVSDSGPAALDYFDRRRRGDALDYEWADPCCHRSNPRAGEWLGTILPTLVPTLVPMNATTNASTASNEFNSRSLRPNHTDQARGRCDLDMRARVRPRSRLRHVMPPREGLGPCGDRGGPGPRGT